MPNNVPIGGFDRICRSLPCHVWNMFRIPEMRGCTIASYVIEQYSILQPGPFDIRRNIGYAWSSINRLTVSRLSPHWHMKSTAILLVPRQQNQLFSSIDRCILGVNMELQDICHSGPIAFGGHALALRFHARSHPAAWKNIVASMIHSYL